MAAPSRSRSGTTLSLKSSQSDSTLVPDLSNRLSSTTSTQWPLQYSSGESIHAPSSASGIYTPRGHDVTPPNPPALTINPSPDQPTSKPHGPDGSFLLTKSTRQLAGRQTVQYTLELARKEVHITVETMTEDEDKFSLSKDSSTIISPDSPSAESSTRPCRSTLHPRLRVRYSRSPSPATPCPIPHVTRRPIAEEDCSICSTSLADESIENLVWCKGACGHNFHQSCFDGWRAYAERPLRCGYWYFILSNFRGIFSY
jgi:hypothetical protein